MEQFDPSTKYSFSSILPLLYRNFAQIYALLMAEYDLNDPTDLDIMRATFDMYTADDWDEYIEEAEARQIGYKNINILKSAQRKAGIAKYLSPKVILWVLRLVEKLDADEEDDDDEEE